MKKLFIQKLIKRISLLFWMRPKYVIYYSLKGKLLWYMIPKAGSRTIKYHLEIVWPDFIYLGYIPIIKILWRNYRKFTVTRNDYERHTSTYRDKVLNRRIWSKEEFEQQITKIGSSSCDPHLKPCRQLYDSEFIDFVCDLKDLRKLFEWLGMTVVTIEHINRTIT